MCVTYMDFVSSCCVLTGAYCEIEALVRFEVLSIEHFLRRIVSIGVSCICKLFSRSVLD